MPSIRFKYYVCTAWYHVIYQVKVLFMDGMISWHITGSIINYVLHDVSSNRFIYSLCTARYHDTYQVQLSIMYFTICHLSGSYIHYVLYYISPVRYKFYLCTHDMSSIRYKYYSCTQDMSSIRYKYYSCTQDMSSIRYYSFQWFAGIITVHSISYCALYLYGVHLHSVQEQTLIGIILHVLFFFFLYINWPEKVR